MSLYCLNMTFKEIHFNSNISKLIEEHEYLQRQVLWMFIGDVHNDTLGQHLKKQHSNWPCISASRAILPHLRPRTYQNAISNETRHGKHDVHVAQICWE